MNRDKPNSVMGGSNLVLFAPGISRQEKDDILDLLLYADYFASQAYRRQEFWKSWMDYYRNRLVRYGSTLKSQITKPPMVISDSHELDRATFAIVGSQGSVALADLVQTSFRALRVDQYARAFFESGRGAGNLGSFQIVPCEKTATGEVLILLCGLHISANTVTDIFGPRERTQRGMVLRLVGGTYAFKPDVYAPHREMIRSRLVANAIRSVQNLEL